MKTLYNFLVLTLLTITTISCEDKVNIDLDTAPPKLVIDAAIKWQKGTDGNEQKIKLTTTTDYYSTIIPIVTGATVYITNSANDVFTFVETPNTGEYVCTNFIPIINENYILTVQYNGETYKASEKLLATPQIDSVEQKTVQGIGGNEIQVKFFYQDNGQEENYYLIGFKNNTIAYPGYGVIKDRFFQGNQMFGFYTQEDLQSGVQLDMSLQGISLRYYNYMDKLINISGGSSGSPFATPPATLIGNIINITNETNYPLGYFSLGEIDTKNYVIQ